MVVNARCEKRLQHLVSKEELPAKVSESVRDDYLVFGVPHIQEEEITEFVDLL